MSQETLDKIYTTDEATERLRLTNDAFIKIARKYGDCWRSGNRYGSLQELRQVALSEYKSSSG